jgi:hypothetical protein
MGYGRVRGEWRRRALEAFPELQQELTGADDSIASQALFLVELHEMGLAAADEGNTDFVRRLSTDPPRPGSWRRHPSTPGGVSPCLWTR